MFRLLNADTRFVEIELDGEVRKVPATGSLAAALLYLDAVPLRRSLLAKSPRAAYCMMGVCFECLVEVDGRVNQRACQVELQAGMRVRLQPGAEAER